MRTDRQDEANIVAFRNFAKAPKKKKIKLYVNLMNVKLWKTEGTKPMLKRIYLYPRK
jgi:hypothetical protein